MTAPRYERPPGRDDVGVRRRLRPQPRPVARRGDLPHTRHGCSRPHRRATRALRASPRARATRRVSIAPAARRRGHSRHRARARPRRRGEQAAGARGGPTLRNRDARALGCETRGFERERRGQQLRETRESDRERRRVRARRVFAGHTPPSVKTRLYRAESAQARDRRALAHADRPRVLDAMAGSGVRSAYLRGHKTAPERPRSTPTAFRDADALFSAGRRRGVFV